MAKPSKEQVEWSSISVRVPTARLPEIDRERKRVNMSRDAYARHLLLNAVPAEIPSINIEAWRDLQKALKSLSDLADWVQASEEADVARLDAHLVLIARMHADLRRRLLDVPARSSKRRTT